MGINGSWFLPGTNRCPLSCGCKFSETKQALCKCPIPHAMTASNGHKITKILNTFDAISVSTVLFCLCVLFFVCSLSFALQLRSNLAHLVTCVSALSSGNLGTEIFFLGIRSCTARTCALCVRVKIQLPAHQDMDDTTHDVSRGNLYCRATLLSHSRKTRRNVKKTSTNTAPGHSVGGMPVQR